VSDIQLDTGAAATDTIDYVVTDRQGLTSALPEPEGRKHDPYSIKRPARPRSEMGSSSRVVD
jgi:hypothetical protein